MDMGFGLFQQQVQKLIITPELRQAITILQYSALDLLEFLQEQMKENPLIELKDNEEKGEQEAPVSDAQKPDMDWEEYFSHHWSEGVVRSGEEKPSPFDFIASKDSSLQSVLEEQVRYTEVADEMKQVAMFIIGNLDERGYLDISLDQIAEKCQVPLEKAEEALYLVQSFEPSGVGARSLKECLLIQLDHLQIEDSLTERVIEKYLDDLAAHRIQKIAGELGVSEREVQSIADFIRTLNPRPGDMYHAEPPRYIVPDVYIEKVEGNYVVLVNDGITPRLSINSYYERMLRSSQSQHQEAKKYIHEKLQSAMWLLKSMEQRRLTLLRVTEAIVEAQRDFLEYGISRLKPLTLKEVAEKVGLHESTISRATSHKYAQTPRGVFELKFFFNSGLSTASGGAASAKTVQLRIKQLIDHEDKSRPLSDQKLADLLAEEGIEISRRTVSKYREEMNIPSSAKRKRY
ncbi:RNA polymerase factor sigma-54 [Microaerobacter geothermalis]|uniref:RNA polymerase factor sigma-54 n=1 Tax=Microaerobacter geothermalis TaxID=674972 RepID=UPI001F1585D4|nr:RNA polymerase factor sigma-54 [Microaerobacter geothermalis]MCF6095385.1 RNA polymerase factor sigma-54 [Microaerobacter geothermalis]